MKREKVITLIPLSIVRSDLYQKAADFQNAVSSNTLKIDIIQYHFRVTIFC